MVLNASSNFQQHFSVVQLMRLKHESWQTVETCYSLLKGFCPLPTSALPALLVFESSLAVELPRLNQFIWFATSAAAAALLLFIKSKSPFEIEFL